MTARVHAFPRARKRGRKVVCGPCAPVVEFPDRSPAALYAQLCSLKFMPEDREAAYADQLEFAKRFFANGRLTRETVREMAENKRARLKYELDAIERFQRELE